jgi:ComF family protein
MTIAEKRSLCAPCFSQIEFVGSPLCLRCGAGLNREAGTEDRWCGSCLKTPPIFDTARSLVVYRGPVRRLLHQLKYSSDTRAAVVLGGLVGEAPGIERFRDHDLIVPVPLFRSRIQQRGLNQALVLAQKVFSGQRQKIEPSLLLRVRKTIAQTGLSGAERRRNLRGAFQLNPRADPAGKKICLVDDIFTTGTTVTECARTLKRNQAAVVDVLTYARA